MHTKKKKRTSLKQMFSFRCFSESVCFQYNWIMSQKKLDHQTRQDSQRDTPTLTARSNPREAYASTIYSHQVTICDKRWQTNKSDGNETRLAEAISADLDKDSHAFLIPSRSQDTCTHIYEKFLRLFLRKFLR